MADTRPPRRSASGTGGAHRRGQPWALDACADRRNRLRRAGGPGERPPRPCRVDRLGDLGELHRAGPGCRTAGLSCLAATWRVIPRPGANRGAWTALPRRITDRPSRARSFQSAPLAGPATGSSCAAFRPRSFARPLARAGAQRWPWPPAWSSAVGEALCTPLASRLNGVSTRCHSADGDTARGRAASPGAANLRARPLHNGAPARYAKTCSPCQSFTTGASLKDVLNATPRSRPRLPISTGSAPNSTRRRVAASSERRRRHRRGSTSGVAWAAASPC